MFTPASLATFAITVLVLVIVPGPTVSTIVGQSLARGTRAGLAVLLGTQLANYSMVLVVALGMEAVIGFMGWAFDWVKLIGAAYLIWIGISMLRSSGFALGNGKVKPKSDWQLVLQGYVVLWSNPKALVFFGAFLPQFIDPSRPTFWQVILFGVVFNLIAAISDGTYAVLAGTARTALTGTRIKLLNRLAGAILVGGGVWLALQKRA
jgi:threonine/homoserine/homoserine lactone efflux protein